MPLQQNMQHPWIYAVSTIYNGVPSTMNNTIIWKRKLGQKRKRKR
jgi:hypothetical protein